MQDISNLQLLWLAVVQGITEFLPVSSSAHLLLFSRLFGFADQGLAIDVAVHGGSLLAVLIYFRARLFELMGGLGDCFRLQPTERARFLVFLIIATLPLLPVGFFLSGFGSGLAETALRSPLVVAFATIFFALLLWYAERYQQNWIVFDYLHWRTALFIGVMQCFALIPGTSRAGVTATACLLAGMRRKEALEIAMLLSIPAIIAAVSLMGLKLAESGDALLTQAAMASAGAAFVCAYAAISLLMRFINKISFLPFVIYRLALGCWLIYMFRHIA